MWRKTREMQWWVLKMFMTPKSIILIERIVYLFLWHSNQCYISNCKHYMPKEWKSWLFLFLDCLLQKNRNYFPFRFMDFLFIFSFLGDRKTEWAPPTAIWTCTMGTMSSMKYFPFFFLFFLILQEFSRFASVMNGMDLGEDPEEAYGFPLWKVNALLL